MSVPDDKYNGYSQRYSRGTTGLHLTARFGLPVISEELLAKLEGEVLTAVNAEDNWDQTPLSLGAKQGHGEIVKLLLHKGAHINGQSGGYGNPLQVAARGVYPAVVERLLQEKADVNTAVAEHGGKTALQAAAEGGHLAVEKADVNAELAEYDGRTALQAAAEGGHKIIVDLLCEAGAQN
jgi:ankyrin repeat protein